MLILLGSPDLRAQYKSEKDATIPLEHFYIERQGAGLRKLLSKLHFSLSTGYVRTTFRHQLDGFGIIQQPDSLPVIFRPNGGPQYYNVINRVTNNPWGTVPGSFTVFGDTAKIGFKSKAFYIPLKATIQVDFDLDRV